MFLDLERSNWNEVRLTAIVTQAYYFGYGRSMAFVFGILRTSEPPIGVDIEVLFLPILALSGAGWATCSDTARGAVAYVLEA